MSKTESITEPFSRYQKFVLILLALLQFAVMLDFMIISPVGYHLTKDLGVNTRQFGLVVSSYIFAAAFTGIVAAGFVDRFDRKKVLIFFFSGFIVGTLFCALSGSFTSLLCSRIIAGIFGGVTSSTSLAIIADVFSARQRGRAMSTVQLSFAASQILGVPFGLWIANHLNWHYTFFVIVVFALLVLLLLVLFLKPLTGHLSNQTDKNPLLHLWKTVKDPRHRIGFSATVVLGLSMMLQPFISIFLVNNLHLSQSDIPFIFMVTGASAFVIMPLVGRLSDKYDKFKIFLIGSVASALVIPFYTHLPVVPLWVVFVLNVAMFAMLMSRMGPFQALNSMIPQPASRGAYMSVSSALQQMSGGLGIVIAGTVVYQETSTSPLGYFNELGYLVVVLSLVAVFLVRRVNVLVKK